MMSTILTRALRTGATAGATSALVAAAAGEQADQQPLAPLNAVSHIIWGDKAGRRDGASWKYTAIGLGLHLAAVTSWALIYEGLLSRTRDPSSLKNRLLTGVAVSGLAYVTDYHLVPERFTPGFEKRLSNGALLAVYTGLAIGLAAGDSSAVDR